MADCVNIKNPEYLTLVKRSGIQEQRVRDYSNYFLRTKGRLPYLDELPYSNSLSSIEETYQIKDGIVDMERLSEDLQTSDTGEQIHKLNDIYRDKLIDIEPITDTRASIEILSRPTIHVKEFFPKDYDNIQINVLNGMLEDIAKYSGLSFKTVSSKEIQSMKDIPNAGITSAFVKDGVIHVNTELLTADSPIHEMLHIFIGGVKHSNPELYQNLLETVSNLESFKVYANNYENRTASDIAEEVLVTQFSKYLTHQTSMFDTIPKQNTQELIYQVKRILDTAIFGDISVKALSDSDLFGKPLVEVAKLVNSDLIRNNFMDIWSNSREHRQLNNMKSSLMKEGLLIERC